MWRRSACAMWKSHFGSPKLHPTIPACSIENNPTKKIQPKSVDDWKWPEKRATSVWKMRRQINFSSLFRLLHLQNGFFHHCRRFHFIIVYLFNSSSSRDSRISKSSRSMYTKIYTHSLFWWWLARLIVYDRKHEGGILIDDRWERLILQIVYTTRTH